MENLGYFFIAMAGVILAIAYGIAIQNYRAKKKAMDVEKAVRRLDGANNKIMAVTDTDQYTSHKIIAFCDNLFDSYHILNTAAVEDYNNWFIDCLNNKPKGKFIVYYISNGMLFYTLSKYMFIKDNDLYTENSEKWYN